MYSLATEQPIFLLAVASAGLSGILLVLGVRALGASLPEENREYMDPLPPAIRPIWPLLRLLAFHFAGHLPNHYLEKLNTRLHHTGVAYLLTPEQFIGLRVVSAVAAPLCAVYPLLLLDALQLVWVAAAAAGGYFLPDVWLRDTRLRRENALIRQLPVYLDFITMAVEAGLNLTGALKQAREKGPPGAMRSEFGIVLRDIRSGLNRAEALRRMADRLDINEITSFVSAIVQADRMGSSLGQTLRTQAEQRRSERFQRAEKQAMEAPVKLVGPLVLFIFPVTFIVLGFPLVMKFMAEGIL